MIRNEELLEAIAECQGQRNPNASTCMKLASYYIIQDHMKEPDIQEAPEVPRYSFAAPPTITYNSGTEFSEKVKDMSIDDILAVMDELMTTLSVINPRLYDGVMRRLVV